MPLLPSTNVLERKKTRERIDLHAIEAVEFLRAIFHRDSQQASIVPREPIFQRHLPEGKQRGRNTGGIGRPVPRLSPIIEPKRVHGI